MNSSNIEHKKNKELKIKILTTESFPLGLAATNRIMTYAKGFNEQKCAVSIHCIKPSERPGHIFNTSISGIYNDIPFSYSGGKTVLATSFIQRRLDNIKGILNIGIQILKEKKKDKTDVIIYYSSSTSRAIILMIISRIKNIIFLKEESEYPEVYIPGLNFIQKFLFNNVHYILFDGLLIMTQSLIQYFSSVKKIKKPLLHVPMTVDFERFEKTPRNTKVDPYIAYCGSLNKAKDGVDILIDAFAIICKKHKDIKLYLIGNAVSEEELQIFKNKTVLSNITEKVLFTGRVNKEKIPELLCNASLLVLPRPESMQSEGGFPTKLGEYLSTGNPVVVTRVGEIPNYLTNQVDVFMAEPGDVDSLANNIHKILEDYSNAKQIALRGKQVAYENFNYRIQTSKILDFIKDLKEN